MYVGILLLFGILATALSRIMATVVFGLVVTMDATAFQRILLLALLVAVIGAIVQSILTGSLTYLAVRRCRDEQVTLGEAFRLGVRRFPSILGASLAVGLIVAGVLLLPVGLLLAGTFSGSFCIVGAGCLSFLVVVPLAIYVAVGLSLYAPAAMIERKTAIGSLKRSWEMAQGRRWTIFLAAFVLVIILSLVSAAITVPLALTLNPYISAVGTVISIAITGSWMIVFAAVAYHLILSESASSDWDRFRPEVQQDQHFEYR